MNYWIDLFTGTTWDEFRKAGSKISGFSQRRHKVAEEIKSGDIFLCYLTGVMRWVGALEAIGPTNDVNPIWKDAHFPVRFEVHPLIVLEPEQGIPMDELEGRVAFYEGSQDRGKFKGFLRGSPNRFRSPADGELIFSLLRQAKEAPKFRPVDPKKLARKPYNLFKAERVKGKRAVATEVSVPEPEETSDLLVSEQVSEEDTVRSITQHTEMQYSLLRLGADMGLDVWVARNDRGKKYHEQLLGSLPRMVSELPAQFNEATNRTIELIDVLWLKGNSIAAAFEVEATTSIYSGLLRMSDLLSLQPNLDIDLYLVAPDERRNKVQQEILRPTFELREKPLSSVCGFLAFSNLLEKVHGIRALGLAKSLKPDFLKDTAEFFGANG
ncbi:MAG TPA: hypothetical protein VF043_19480 [Ktedonobacteraceae bacterium]